MRASLNVAYLLIIISSLQGINNHPGAKKRRLRLQDTRKLGCSAKIFVRRVSLYPDYDVSDKAKIEKHAKVRTN